jgi:hypothetical protein
MKSILLVMLIAFSTFLLYYCQINSRSSKIEDSSKKLSSGSGLRTLEESANISKSEFNQSIGSSEGLQVKSSEFYNNQTTHLPTSQPTIIKTTTYPSVGKPSYKLDRPTSFIEIIAIIAFAFLFVFSCVLYSFIEGPQNVGEMLGIPRNLVQENQP